MANDFDAIFGDYQPPSALEKVAGTFRKLGHTLSMIPILSSIAGFPTGIAAVLDTVDGYFNKGFGAGTKALISGTIDTAVTGATSILTFGSAVFWLPMNWVAGISSGSSLGELARKGTNAVLDSFIPDSFSGVQSPTQVAREMQVLGANPMTIGAVPAAVGYAQMPQMQMGMQAPINPATLAPVQPNQWRQMEAQRRGQTLEQADAQWVSNNREEALALQRAGASPQQIGA